MRNGICAIVIGMLITLSCGSNATGPSEGQSDNWWPMEQGNSWTYLEGNETLIITVLETGISMPFANNLASIVWGVGGLYPDTSYWENTNEFVKLWFYTGEEWESGSWLEYPLSVGKTWGSGLACMTCVSLSETVTVPAGTFENCAKIVWPDAVYDEEGMYYCQGVGLVKQYWAPGDNDNLELVSYTF